MRLAPRRRTGSELRLQADIASEQKHSAAGKGLDAGAEQSLGFSDEIIEMECPGDRVVPELSVHDDDFAKPITADLIHEARQPPVADNEKACQAVA